MILGEQVGEFLMPPFRCFFLGERAECSSSTTETVSDDIKFIYMYKTHATNKNTRS